MEPLAGNGTIASTMVSPNWHLGYRDNMSEVASETSCPKNDKTLKLLGPPFDGKTSTSLGVRNLTTTTAADFTPSTSRLTDATPSTP
jgi:hypothetical protein